MSITRNPAFNHKHINALLAAAEKMLSSITIYPTHEGCAGWITDGEAINELCSAVRIVRYVADGQDRLKG